MKNDAQELHYIYCEHADSVENQSEPADLHPNTLIFDCDVPPADYELFDNCMLRF